jgi:hypothetical protein
VSGTIAINAVQLGVETDYPDFRSLWFVLENVITFIFTVELICKLCVLKRRFFHCAWNWMDFALTLTAVIDTWILSFYQENLDVRAATVLRALRLLRLLRIVKLFQRFRQFMLVIAGIIDAAKCCVWVSLVLAVTIYAFSIFSVRVIGRGAADTYPGYTSSMSDIEESSLVQGFNPFLSFGTMPRAMLTLLNMALLDGWGDIARPMLMYQPWLLPFFIFFVLFVTLGVMNVIVGMICDSVLSKAQAMQLDDRKQVRIGKLHLLERLHGLLETMDSNEDGKVDAEELKMAIQNEPEVLALIESVDLPEGFSAEELVLLLDSNGDGLLSYDDFIRSLYRLIDGGDFQQLCLMQMNINTIKHHVVDMKKQSMKSQEMLAARLQRLEERMMGSSKVDMARQTQQKMHTSAADVAEEFSEPSEDEDLHENFSQWRKTLTSLKDATATTKLKLSNYVEQVSVALEEVESVHASLLVPPNTGLQNSASTRARSVAVRSKRQSCHPSVARQIPLSPPMSGPCSSVSQITCTEGHQVEERHQAPL